MKQSISKQARTDVHRPPPARRVNVFPSWPIAISIFAAAVVLRLLWLGEASFRADTLHFYQWAQRGLSFSQVFGNWLQIMGEAAQFPLSAACAVGLVDLLHLPPTPFNVRLADVFFGGVAVLFGAMAGKELGGKPLMFFSALLWIFSPFHVQLSREAYFYSSLVTGSSMLFWAVLFYARRRSWSVVIPGSFYWIVGVGLFLSAYSHFTGWIIAAMCSVSLIFMSWNRAKRMGIGKGEFNRLLIIPVAVAFPLLFYPWAIPYFLKDIGNPAAKAESIRIMGEVTEPMWSILSRYALTMGWGSWSAGMIITIMAISGFVVYGWKTRRRVVITSIILLVVGLIAYVAIMKSRGIYVAVRHVSFIFPIYFTLLALGLWEWWNAVGGKLLHSARIRTVLRGSTVLLSVGMLLYPVWQVLKLTGYPTPYPEIKTWFDSSLPPGTPVLVDRWFEPWNELTIYPSTNVVFTFTGPNEPVDVFISSHWREQAQAFLEKNPDAAYFEIAKSYWDNPAVGPWNWPRDYFARHTAISNSAGLVLRDLGLAYREDFYPTNNNRVVVDIFYNTREDVLNRLRKEKVPFQVFYGRGITYEKSGPMQIFRFQTQMFGDWRIMENGGELDVANLTDAPASVMVKISAVSPRGPKMVTSDNGQRMTFTGSRLQSWEIGPLQIPPGMSKVTVMDSMWERSMNPLLIADTQIVSADQSISTSASTPVQPQ